MSFDESEVRNRLANFDFRQLFVNDLGWDVYDSRPLNVLVDGKNFELQPFAHKRGMAVFLCQASTLEQIPDYSIRLKVDRQVSKSVFEHIIIYIDSEKTRQIWQWVRRQIGKPAASREQSYYRGQRGDALIQKLRIISFSLEEEESLTVSDVTKRAKLAFDVEVVTKKFYDQYKKEHALFIKSILGIKLDSDKAWYGSVMLNRLMFIYFIQKKRFLDNDTNYLRHKLKVMQELRGKNKFFSFYRHFLLRLFHEGLGSRSRNADLDSLLGKVPYLNGGLFELHELERGNTSIEIPDSSFERLFDFFDNFQWYLDDRPLKKDNEINPDVIGYIFEKYVNQKEMGAYYTRDDITEYMASNIVIPQIFEALIKVGITRERLDEQIRRMVSDNPDRYLDQIIRRGIINQESAEIPVPAEIAAGLRDTSRRKKWNLTAESDFQMEGMNGLSSESWREYLSRRQYLTMVRSKITKGEHIPISDFVTYNLNIRQFAEDYIRSIDDPNLILDIYTALRTMSVLDPTCGSGAFLFQVLNILEPLYEACLEQIQKFVRETKLEHASGKKEAIASLTRILADSEKHPNQRYSIYRSIILGNLFGVDIMQEATEICKLRLFLKLAAQVEPDFAKPNFGLEPLPDIDFNIRCGNALVGFSTLEQVRSSLKSGQLKIGGEEILANIESKAKAVELSFENFKEIQNQPLTSDKDLSASKKDLQSKLESLEKELDQYLAIDYEVNLSKKENFSSWIERYKPFHWFIEFYAIMKRGGFDVVIGNPPYLELREVDYVPRGFKCEDTKAIHAMCVEKSLSLLQPSGCLSMIVPLSIVSTQRMKVVQDLIEKSHDTWYSNFAWRPGKLFDVVNRALTIFVALPKYLDTTYSTSYQKWNSDERDLLFHTIRYCRIPRNRKIFWAPKLGDSIELSIFDKLFSIRSTVSNFCSESDNLIYRKSTGGLYWKVFTDFPPLFRLNGKKASSSRETSFSVAKAKHVRALIAILSSDIYWWFYSISTNLRDLNANDIDTFPLPEEALDDPEIKDLGTLYLNDLKKNSTLLVRQQERTGKTETQSFKIQKSKHIIDRIDSALAKYYGFTDEELDFISNYDIRFRMSDTELEE
jgi:hypothetical protein